MTEQGKPPITIGRAIDRITKIREERAQACRKAAQVAGLRHTKREGKVLAQLSSNDQTRILAMLGAAADVDVGPFGNDVDPADSDRLQELRAAVDDYLGWENAEEEEAGDYVARVKQVGEKIRALRRPTHTDEPTPDPTPRGTTEYVPGPAATAARSNRR